MCLNCKQDWFEEKFWNFLRIRGCVLTDLLVGACGVYSQIIQHQNLHRMQWQTVHSLEIVQALDVLTITLGTYGPRPPSTWQDTPYVYNSTNARDDQSSWTSCKDRLDCMQKMCLPKHLKDLLCHTPYINVILCVEVSSPLDKLYHHPKNSLWSH